jgi:hypothetical protein
MRFAARGVEREERQCHNYSETKAEKGKIRGRVREDRTQNLICNAGPGVPRSYQSIIIPSCKKNWISHRLVS